MATTPNQAIVGLGTSIKKGTTTIALLNSIHGLDMGRDHIETTALDTVGGYKTFVGGLRDAGEVSLVGHFNPITHAGLHDDFESGLTSSYVIEFADKGTGTTGTTWKFDGVVTAYKTDADLAGLVKFESKIKVSGQPILTPATGV